MWRGMSPYLSPDARQTSEQSLISYILRRSLSLGKYFACLRRFAHGDSC